MDIIKRVLAVFLVATAVAVALNLILTPFYYDLSQDYPVWKIIKWFMAGGALIALAVSFLRKRTLNSKEASTLDYIRVSAVYYGAIVLAMLFFWGWFWTLNLGSEIREAGTLHHVYFPIVDALFVVVTLSVGNHLWGSYGVADA